MNYLEHKRILLQQGLTEYQAHVKALELTKTQEEKTMNAHNWIRDPFNGGCAYYCYCGARVSAEYPTTETEGSSGALEYLEKQMIEMDQSGCTYNHD